MTTTLTRTTTSTFTVTDIRRVIAAFAATYRAIAESTQLHAQTERNEIVRGVTVVAEAGYLAAVDIVLRKVDGAVKCALHYRVSTSAEAWEGERPDLVIWSTDPGDKLEVVICFNGGYCALSSDARTAWVSKNLPGWGDSDLDLGYPGLAGSTDRRHASRGYGIERTHYS